MFNPAQNAIQAFAAGIRLNAVDRIQTHNPPQERLRRLRCVAGVLNNALLQKLAI